MKTSMRSGELSNKKSIKRKVIVQFSGLVTFAMLVMITLVIYLVNQYMGQQTSALLQSKASAVQQRMEQRIRYLVENSELLTTNELMVNALIDAEGRKTYLPPLVENFMEGKDVVSLNVVDFDGRPIFQTQEEIPRYNESSQLRASLALGQVTLYIQKSDDQMVVIAPIEYYDTTQGSVVVVFDLAAIAERNLPRDENAYMKLFKADHILYQHNVLPDEEYQAFRLSPSGETTYLTQLGLSVELGLPESVYRAPVRDAVLRLTLLGVSFILIGVILAIVLAGTITRPILELYRRIRQSTETEESIRCAPLGTDDELEILAEAFDERTMKLDYLNKNLQNEVDQHLVKIREQDQIMAQQSKMALMGEMMSAIAHQWRQPLNALALDLQDIREAYTFGELDEAYIKNSVETSMEKINFLSNTINDFKDFFKPQVERETFLISEAFKNVTSIIGAELGSHHISLDIVDDDFELTGFKNNLSQVFLNIINNAKEAIIEQQQKDSGYKGFITVTIYEASGSKVVTIEDNGGGVPEDIMEKIFNPYFSTKFAAQGIGLGLYMSKMIIEKHHNGTIEVENGMNGARFTISFPDEEAKKIKIG